jgi:hypothetical protein
LVGLNDDKLGPRFPSVSDAFDSNLQDIVLQISSELGFSDSIRPNGTYCCVSGPGYESKAESRFLLSLGGDSVGMSTVPEVLAAKHCGMKILGLSLITNKVVMKADKNAIPASHTEVLEAVEKSGKKVEQIVKAFAMRNEVKEYMSKLPEFTYIPSKLDLDDVGTTVNKAIATDVKKPTHIDKKLDSNYITVQVPYSAVVAAVIILTSALFVVLHKK